MSYCTRATIFKFQVSEILLHDELAWWVGGIFRISSMLAFFWLNTAGNSTLIGNQLIRTLRGCSLLTGSTNYLLVALFYTTSGPKYYT